MAIRSSEAAIIASVTNRGNARFEAARTTFCHDTVEISIESWPKRSHQINRTLRRPRAAKGTFPTYATSRWLNPTLTLFTSTLLENSSAVSTLPVGVVGDRLLTSVHFASITVARVFGDPVTLSAPDPDRTASKNDSPPLRCQT